MTTSHPDPDYLLGAMATDGLPDRLALKLAESYAAMLPQHSAEAFDHWSQAVRDLLGEHGHICHETYMTLMCHPSDHDHDRYTSRARDLRERVGQEK